MDSVLFCSVYLCSLGISVSVSCVSQEERMNPGVLTAAAKTKLPQIIHIPSRNVISIIIFSRSTCQLNNLCSNYNLSKLNNVALNKCYHSNSLSYISLTASRLTCQFLFRNLKTSTIVPFNITKSTNCSKVTTKSKEKNKSVQKKEKEDEESSSSSSSDSDSDSDSDDEESKKKKKSSQTLNPKSSVLFTGGKSDDEVDEILYFLREPYKTRFGPVKVAITILAGLGTGALVAKVSSHLLAKYDIYVFEDEEKDKEDEQNELEETAAKEKEKK